MGDTLKMKECDTMRILVVEDDRLLNNTLCYNLNTAGYTVDSVLTKSAASGFLTKQDYDLIVLDINLPDGNGFDFCREVKERRPDTAIIFLTANDMESDMLKGYELGADDYVTKPFTPLELLARVNSQLRRYRRFMEKLGDKEKTQNIHVIGGLELDEERVEVRVDGELVKVTPMEYKILLLLMKNPGRVFSADEIYERVWNERAVNTDTIMVHVRNIREKIEINPKEPKYLKVVWGVGYKIEKQA